jgi:hypothetical protein
MKLGLFILAQLLFAIHGQAQKNIPLQDIDKNVGDSVQITAIVQGASYQVQSQGAPTYLQLGTAVGGSATAVIWGADRAMFHTVPETAYTNKEVQVSGRVEMINGKACIVIRNELQLSIILSGGGSSQ